MHTVSSPLLPVLIANIDAALVRAQGDRTYADGYSLLRWFLNGWIAHPDPQAQTTMALFHYARDLDGAIVPANSAQGGHILNAARSGALIRTLELAHVDR